MDLVSRRAAEPSLLPLRALVAGLAVLNPLLSPDLEAGASELSGPAAPEARQETTGNEISDEIVVTARKREEDIQDVPVAITVLSGEQLEERAASDISEIQADVPNLSIYSARNQSSTLTAFLRGVGQAEPLWGVDPGVGLYLDDVYMARAQGALLDVFDAQRVEVLRGPQGTLYGKNTIGGAIRYISRPLSDAVGGSVRLTAGEHGTAEVRATAGGALVPGKLRARAAVASLSRDGYGRNLFTGRDVNDKDTTALRLSLDWLPAENLVLKLRFDRTEDDSEPKGHTRLAANPFCPAFNGTPCAPLPNLFDTEAGQEPLNGTDSSGTSLTAEWILGDHWTFRSITAARRSDTLNFQDFDTTPASIVEAGSSYSDEHFSQEVQFTYGRGGSSGVLGLYYFNGRAGGEIRQLIFGNNFSTLGGEVHTDSIALFGDGSYAFSDRLTLHFGLRVTEETKRGISFNAAYADATFSEITGVISDFDREVTFTSLAPKLGLDVALRDDVMAYVTLSRGFKAGGFNVRAQQQAFPESAEPYDDEVLTVAEAGVKSRLAGGSLGLNAAVFRGAYDDVQVGTFTSFDSDGDGVDDNFFGSFGNAGNATIQGAEVEFDWTSPAISWLALAGQVSYLDATPDDFVDGNGDGFVDTQVITNAPRWSGALHLDVDFPAWDGLLTGRLTWAYRDASTLTSEGGPDPRDPTRPLLPLVQPAFDLFHAGVAWTSGSGAWQVGVNGKNLGDEEYLLSGYNVPILGVIVGNYAAPRTVTATLGYRF